MPSSRDQLQATLRTLAYIDQFLAKVPTTGIHEARALVDAAQWVVSFHETVSAQLKDLDKPAAAEVAE